MAIAKAVVSMVEAMVAPGIVEEAVVTGTANPTSQSRTNISIKMRGNVVSISTSFFVNDFTLTMNFHLPDISDGGYSGGDVDNAYDNRESNGGYGGGSSHGDYRSGTHQEPIFYKK